MRNIRRPTRSSSATSLPASCASSGALDTRIDAALAAGWPLQRLDTTLRAILRAGAYELQFRDDVPPKAAINEYVEVGHAFYEGDEMRMINGVLDRLARELRPDQMGPPRRG